MKLLRLLILFFCFVFSFNFTFSSFYNDFTKLDSPNWITSPNNPNIYVQQQVGNYLQFAPLVIALGFIVYYQDSNLFKLIKKEKSINDLLENKAQAYKDEGLLQLGLTTALALGNTYAFKYAVGRPRPGAYDEGVSRGDSFPSGHSTIAFAPSFFIALRYGWLKAIPALAISTFVGYTRVAARNHYITDVIAAAGFSFIYAFIFTFKYEYKGVHIELSPPMRAQYGLGLNIYW